MRFESLQQLSSQTFDVLVIGGGATGTGIAVDAATRGLKTALVERADFSSETSSRSTKLLHGGVRYLEHAFKQLDSRELELVRTALEERGNTLRNAPYLCHGLPILTPVYSLFEAAYLWTGFKLYDLLAHDPTFPNSRFLSKAEVLKRLPQIQSKGLVAGLLYYDGQFDDARLNTVLAKTAFEEGAAIVNYVSVTGFERSGKKLTGVKLVDQLTGQQWNARARVVVNATGAFSDELRLEDDRRAKPMVSASSGTHIVLDASFLPNAYGMLIPKTKDGRVLFILPWQGKTLVGTTDEPHRIQANPKPTEEDIEFILETMQDYYLSPPTRKDILSAWTGLRPLVTDPSKKDTSDLSRDHVIHVSESGLITIVGGKWTTYRKMAEECVDVAVQLGKLRVRSNCRTEHMRLIGAKTFTDETVGDLQRRYSIDGAMASHLAYHYGDRSARVMEIAKQGYQNCLHPRHPNIEAEVVYAIREEFAQTPIDVLARRTRIAFLDSAAAREALPRVVELMSGELGWNAETAARMTKEGTAYLC